MTELEKLQQATESVRERLSLSPKIALVLGSGMSEVLQELEGVQRLAWEQIPHFPRATVMGHAGEWVWGRIEQEPVLISRGRVHYYEGYSMAQIAFPIRLMKLLGIERLILTNAAGGINTDYRVGDFVLIRDHINTIPDNPLRGENISELGSRFPNLLDAYSARWRAQTKAVAQELGLELREGVYIATPGPIYETPAEIEAYRRWGADLVGMSTVPEVIAARHCGLEVLAISLVTNLAAGLGSDTLTHEEVLETTKRRERDLARLLQAVVRGL
ncbi:purine-nucleoside phosphorylase [Candidatus Acetothermia bacterium]|jgi:purine-nucleoside phosphorylase|nr:purine-nucleoside phosphorylase [Candidatus Acetothermia bacterium]MCI2432294.1 purine-nucleoside phosphorylase [Candidatus Acetothermia bacterium]MCI2437419.1 purine-nucleoside phosphorylase [Candidatus Acetothermia bacterium]